MPGKPSRIPGTGAVGGLAALDLELGVEYAEMEEGGDPEDHWPE